MNRPRPAVALALLGLLVALPASAAQDTDAARRGAEYIAQRQAPDGAFFAPGRPADSVAEALAAVVAGGGPRDAVERALRYLGEHGPDRAAEKPAYAGRIALGLHAAGQDPSTFRGTDYVAAARAGYNPATGAYDSNLYANALAAFGVVAGGEALPERAVTYLRGNQCASGGFAWREGCLGQPDVDTTTVIVNLLAAGGVEPSDGAVQRARSWLRDAQNADGGFGGEPGQPTNANSTGLALSALAALGEDPTSAAWRRDGGDPLRALASLQNPDGGVRYLAGDERSNDYATVQAVPGLAGRGHPVTAGDRPVRATGSDGTPPPGTTRPPEAAASPRQPAAGAREAPASGEHRAGLVVRLADGEVRRMCVFFDEPEITGEELLALSGIEAEVERSAMGTAMCRIGPEGCDPGDCFCEYPTFWGYWTRDADTEPWGFSEVGAHERAVRDGSLDGWVWGVDGEPPPPDEPLDEVCAAAADPDPEADDPAAAPAEGEPARAGRTLAGFVALAAVLVAGGGLLAVRRRRLGP